MKVLTWFPMAALCLLAPVAALGEITDRPGLEFEATEHPMIKQVILPEGDGIFVYLRHMRPEVTVYFVCPDHDDMLEVRHMLSGGDGDLHDFVLGKGCIAATGGHGLVTHVHGSRVLKVDYWHLEGHDIDSGSDIDIEHPEQDYWAMSVQLGTMFTSPVNQRVEPLVNLAFGR